MDAEQIKAKIEVIKASNMPEAKKQEYIEELQPTVVDNRNKIPFTVYAKIKKIPLSMQGALLVYPKAKGVNLATLKEWEEIFKGF